MYFYFVVDINVWHANNLIKKAERLACYLNSFILIQLQTNNYLHIAFRNKQILPFTQRRRTLTSHDNVYESLPVIVCHLDRIYQHNM